MRIESILRSHKQKESENIEYYKQQVKDFIEENGEVECPYLRYRIAMETYHRGRLELINELIRECK